MLPQVQTGKPGLTAAEYLQLHCWVLEGLRTYWDKLAFCSVCRAHRASESSLVAEFLGIVIVKKKTLLLIVTVSRGNDGMRTVSSHALCILLQWWCLQSIHTYVCDELWFPMIHPMPASSQLFCCTVLFPFDTEIIQELYYTALILST